MRRPIPPEVIRLCQDTAVVDLHVDSLTWLCMLPYRLEKRHWSWPVTPMVRLNHVDLPKLRDGMVNIVWWGIVPHPFSQKASQGVLRKIEKIRKLIDAHREDLHLILNLDDIDRALSAHKIGCFLTVEGGHALEGDLSLISRYHGMGVRTMNLVHLIDNPLGPCSRPRSRNGRSGHLTALGREAVQEMERVGIVVDVAHLQESAIEDVLGLCKRPVVSSHGACASVYPHWRNLSDDTIREIAKRGGVLGVFFIRQWLGPRWMASIEDVAEHIERIVEVAGHQAPAIGSDFDGTPMMPRGLRDATDLPRLAEVLLRRGMSPETVKGVMGGNALQFMRQALKRG